MASFCSTPPIWFFYSFSFINLGFLFAFQTNELWFYHKPQTKSQQNGGWIPRLIFLDRYTESHRSLYYTVMLTYLEIIPLWWVVYDEQDSRWGRLEKSLYHCNNCCGGEGMKLAQGFSYPFPMLLLYLCSIRQCCWLALYNLSCALAPWNPWGFILIWLTNHVFYRPFHFSAWL